MLAPNAPPVRVKSPDAFRTISEVATELDVPQHVLRFWEARFPQVRPVKRAGGRRYYRPEDVDLLSGIRELLYADGFTIRGVQKILRERGLRHVSEIGRVARGREGRPLHSPVRSGLVAGHALRGAGHETHGSPVLPPEKTTVDAGAVNEPVAETAFGIEFETEKARPVSSDQRPSEENGTGDGPEPDPTVADEREAGAGVEVSFAETESSFETELEEDAEADRSAVVEPETPQGIDRARLEALLEELLSLKARLRTARELGGGA